jgi:hypothetical protein
MKWPHFRVLLIGNRLNRVTARFYAEGAFLKLLGRIGFYEATPWDGTALNESFAAMLGSRAVMSLLVTISAALGRVEDGDPPGPGYHRITGRCRTGCSRSSEPLIFDG